MDPDTKKSAPPGTTAETPLAEAPMSSPSYLKSADPLFEHTKQSTNSKIKELVDSGGIPFDTPEMEARFIIVISMDKCMKNNPHLYNSGTVIRLMQEILDGNMHATHFAEQTLNNENPAKILGSVPFVEELFLTVKWH